MKGKINVLKTKIEGIIDQNTILKHELEQERSLLQEAKKEISSLDLENVKLTSSFENLSLRLEQEQENAENQIEKFEYLAQKALSHQSESLDKKQKAGMKEILEPLKEKIKGFEDRIEQNNINTIKQHESLKEQIKFLNDKSEQVSRDANNLVKALKGDYKKQGNWGELILESILDKSGLSKNREFFIQVTEKDEYGNVLRPDVVIHLPDNKKIIIDSKVSLSAYESMINSPDEESQIIAQKLHVVAVKNHIDNLASKNYHDLYKMDSPDFVLMFIPIDTAFSSAIEYDPDIYGYAFEKNIVIVTSSTLLATLKTVESMWRNDKQNRYAIQIADEAGKMYDKFVGFVQDLDKLGNQINTSQNTYHDAMKKLTTGKGNLLSRGEKLKELGAKANKKLPKADE